MQKYGGTSVAGAERIKAVAARVAATVRAGNRVAVVVSAMAGETDRLLHEACAFEAEPNPEHVDFLLATGEQQSVAFLALALDALGQSSKVFTGFQAGLLTDGNHGRARIVAIDPAHVAEALGEGKVAIVAGFQGVSQEGEITTIGRGGSDTSAVALAAALRADRCEIYTDVEGVLTADPRICSKARTLPRISSEEMMELSDAGARVIHSRAVELAAKFRVPLVVKSSFPSPHPPQQLRRASGGEGQLARRRFSGGGEGGGGTWIVPEEGLMEGAVVSGITCNTGEAKVAIRRVPDKVGVTARIFEPIARAGINVDLIIQNVSADGHTDLTFTVPKEDLRRAMTLAEAAARAVEAGKVETAGDIAKISAVGLGMRSHAGVAHRMFDALAKEGIAIQMIGTSEIKVSIIIDIKYAELAVRVLHDAFGLET